ncbi:cytochrome P450 [Nocardia gamkensis]|uniref:cytochrome P450 n=1 Tax=Nocardia gamkensis TaxID=352869 RepID=UPI0033DD25AB
MTTTRSYSSLDVSASSFWAQTAVDREETFKLLRESEPISWQRPTDGGLLPVEENDGYWAVVRHQDIRFVSNSPDLFCSGKGVQLENIPEEFLEATQSFLAMDAPRHTKLRKLVSAAFTPRRIATIEEQIRNQATRIVDDLIATGDCDFVHQVSMRLPMWTICEMVGVPADERILVATAADTLVSHADPEARGDREPAEMIMESIVTLAGTAIEMVQARRETPQDDLMTNLVHAEVDGDRLTDEEICAFFVLLAVAGNDTTRNTITHTILALQENPAQKEFLLDDFDGRIGVATEEFVRWASPVLSFRRTATQDTEIAGQRISAGEKVVMFYPSGNRDGSVFSDPTVFDLGRNPNPHQGFGGGGPHFCLGNGLAKMQLRAVFSELLFRVPTLRVGEPQYLVSNFVHAVKSLPCTL